MPIVAYPAWSPGAGDDDLNSPLHDTWEWQSSTRKWTQLFPQSIPDCMIATNMAMVTDSGRAKLLLFGGVGRSGNPVWEWDGATTTWTNRTPVPGSVTCESKCDGTCVSCNQTGRAGKCSAYAAGSPDAGRDSFPTDAARADGSRDSSPPDAGPTMGLGHKGCSCNLGQTMAGAPGLPFVLLGVAFSLRRRRWGLRDGQRTHPRPRQLRIEG